MIEVLWYITGVAVFIIAIFFSIALHELGHLLYAKKYGCRVSTYMIGFGPTLFSFRPKKKLADGTYVPGETEYGIKAIPLGGYVKIIGMMPPAPGADLESSMHEAKVEKVRRELEEAKLATGLKNAETEHILKMRRKNSGSFKAIAARSRQVEFELIEPGDEGRLFYQLPAHRKMMVMFAGPAVNIVIAFACFLGVYGIYGVHSTEATGSTVITSVADCVIPEAAKRSSCQAGDPESPAKQAGIQVGDQIVAFNGQQTQTWAQLSELIRSNGTNDVVFTVLREGARIDLEPTPTVVKVRNVSADPNAPDVKAVGFVGISQPTQTTVTRHGPIYTMVQMGDMTVRSLESIATLPGRVWNVAVAIVGQEQRDPEGPMSIVGGSRLAGEVAASQIPGFDISAKSAMLALVIGSFNLFVGLFNLLPLLPLDGGHIFGAAWEGLRRKIAQWRGKTDPGFIDVAKQLPVAYCVIATFLVMSAVLFVGDILVPISMGL